MKSICYIWPWVEKITFTYTYSKKYCHAPTPKIQKQNSKSHSPSTAKRLHFALSPPSNRQLVPRTRITSNQGHTQTWLPWYHSRRGSRLNRIDVLMASRSVRALLNMCSRPEIFASHSFWGVPTSLQSIRMYLRRCVRYDLTLFIDLPREYPTCFFFHTVTVLYEICTQLGLT